MSTTETQAGSDIVERKHQGDICDPWIYFRVAVAADRNEWFAIKNKLDQVGDDQLLLPALDPEPFRRYSACVAAGSTIYVFGGEEQVEDWNPPCTRDVFYIDTLCPEKGWKKLSSSLNIPRQEPYGVHIDGKIYVLGGFAPDYPFQVSTIVPEVFDTRRVEEGWRELKDTEDAPVLVNGHAVLDGGKRIFVFGHMNELNVFIVTMIDGRCIIRISEKIGGHLPLMTGFCISWTRA